LELVQSHRKSKVVLEKIKKILQGISRDDGRDEPDSNNNRDAGTPVPVRRRPPDHGSSAAVAEPNDDE
jgi:hypothetical protein